MKLKAVFKYICLVLFLTVAVSSNVLAQEKKTYTVQKGETLFAISKKLNVSITELKSWNDLSSNNLSVGQELLYYTGAAPETKPPVEPAESLISDTGTASNTYYTVKSGDNLYTIARLHNMTLEQLKDLNNLSSNTIRVGQKLAVKKISVAPSVSESSSESTPQGAFSLYEVQRNESLEDLLERFSMTREEFRELNADLDLSTFDRGQKVTVLLPPTRSYDNPYLQKADLENLGELPAEVYREREKGTVTTNGELYDPEALTAAHSSIALGRVIFVENKATGNGIYIRINDRITGPGLKLSEESFRILKLDASANPRVTIYQ